LRGERLAHELEALEYMAEHAVELVEVALALDQRGAREIVEDLDPDAGEVLLHRLHQREIFAQRHRHAGGLELVEKANEHGRKLAPLRRAVKPGSTRSAHVPERWEPVFRQGHAKSKRIQSASRFDPDRDAL